MNPADRYQVTLHPDGGGPAMTLFVALSNEQRDDVAHEVDRRPGSNSFEPLEHAFALRRALESVRGGYAWKGDPIIRVALQ